MLARINGHLAYLVMQWRAALGATAEQLMKQYEDAINRYHIWYYRNVTDVSWLGIPTAKSVADMWNYQEIIAAIRPRLVVEFGTLYGGSALFFQTVLSAIQDDYRVLTVDTNHSHVHQTARNNPRIEFLTSSSVDEGVAARIRELRAAYPGPVFFILDSDHRARHVLRELKLLRAVTRPGDYVIVEDGNVNGHPVMPEHGPGPFEAVTQYFSEFPGDYERDGAREQKFGFTYAPQGFLVRK